MKNKLIETLKNTEGYISGQDLCERFQVSRTAIWKYMKILKEEGYQIDSVNNKGYRLISCPDSIKTEAIEPYLKTKWVGRNIHYFEETDSTNNRAKALGESLAPAGTLCIAEQQNAGKGRRGRSWSSPRGTGIWMSLLLRPEIRPEEAARLTLVAAMAIAKSMSHIEGISYGIKWPNDIIVNRKKICGILTEMSTEMNDINYVVVGIGINVNTESFPEDISPVATSLKIETGRKIDRAKIVADVLNYFEGYYETFVETGDLSNLIDDYNALLLNKNQMVRIIEKEEERIMEAIGIDELGALLVKNEAQEVEKIISGEVSVRGILGYI